MKAFCAGSGVVLALAAVVFALGGDFTRSYFLSGLAMGTLMLGAGWRIEFVRPRPPKPPRNHRGSDLFDL